MATANGPTQSKGNEKYTFFWTRQSVFSQFHPANFTVDGVVYNCSEQYMMHQKAVLFGDTAIAEQIMAAEKPPVMKALGREVSNFDADVWNGVCRDIVKKGNVAKFGQNEHLWKEMKATVGTVLVEASPRDKIWGIGLSADDKRARNKYTWRGKNWLGYALTAARTELLETKA